MKALPVIAVLSALLLAACEDGSLRLSITDAPIDTATAVVVQFSGVELRRDDGERKTIDFDPPKSIDLLRLNGGVTEVLLDETRVTAGRYQSLTLKLVANSSTTDSYIDLADGSRASLFVPSTAADGLRIVSDFEVPDAGVADFTIDFDLRKSVRAPDTAGDAYELRPALRLIETARAGHVAGQVSAALADAVGCSAAVYVYGGDVTPDDVGGSGAQPLSSALVRRNAAGDHVYRVAFLPAGSYTVAFTCKAAEDDPSRNDDIDDFVRKTATVGEGSTATVNF